MRHVVHVIPTLSREGPSRALLTATSGSELHHHVVSLRPGDPWMAQRMREGGIGVSVVPDRVGLRAILADADIVQIHFWNNPKLYRLLGTELPPMRLLVWVHVSGEHPPQVLPGALSSFRS